MVLWIIPFKGAYKIRKNHYKGVIRNVYNLEILGKKEMGLFGKKKEEKTVRPSLQIEDLPEFPDVPIEKQELPAYRPSLTDIKQEVGKADDFEIPRRVASKRDVSRFEEARDKIVPTRGVSVGSKPLFVKIDRYKKALHAIDILRKKISDAEACLKEVETIRGREERKLSEWKDSIQKLKDQLLEIDENLFEV